MHPRTTSWRAVAVLALGAWLMVPVSSGAAPFGTSFTYQGILAYGTGPAAGVFDFRFILYDADAGGAQVGSTVLVDDLAVADGRVVTTLDFGAVFTGNALWLEVAVREGASTGGYTTLSPRQPLSATPYAQRATTAATATTATSAGYATSAGNAAQLNGQNPAYYLAWANLTGVPLGLADGDDDTLAGLSCGEGQVVTWESSAWTCADAADALISTYVVGPGGADAVANGTALLAAVAALPTASETDPLLLKLEPGVYDLGDQQLVLPAWVDLEGSGREVTTIASTVCGSFSSGCTLRVMGSDVRGLTVSNGCATAMFSGMAVSVYGAARLDSVHVVSEGDAPSSYGISILADAVTMHDSAVTVLPGTGNGQTEGVYQFTGSLTLENVDIEVDGTFSNLLGLVAWGGGTLTLRDVSISLSGDVVSPRAVDIRNAAKVDARNVVVEASSTAASGVVTAVRVKPEIGADVILENLRVRAQGTISDALTAYDGGTWRIVGADLVAPTIGMRAGDSSGTTFTMVIADSRVEGGTYGVWASNGSGTTAIDIIGSVIKGATNSVGESSPSTTGRIGGSMLSGGVVSGSFTCAGVWDENFVFSSSTCP